MQLPDWGFHQLEVCTDKSIKQTNTIWNVEEHQQNITYRKFLWPAVLLQDFLNMCLMLMSFLMRLFVLPAEGQSPTEVEKKTEQLERAFKPMPFLSKFWEIQVRLDSVHCFA